MTAAAGPVLLGAWVVLLLGGALLDWRLTHRGKGGREPSTGND